MPTRKTADPLASASTSRPSSSGTDRRAAPGVAAPIQRLAAAWRMRPGARGAVRLLVVHRPPRRGPSSRALTPGGQAVPWQDFVTPRTPGARGPTIVSSVVGPVGLHPGGHRTRPTVLYPCSSAALRLCFPLFARSDLSTPHPRSLSPDTRSSSLAVPVTLREGLGNPPLMLLNIPRTSAAGAGMVSLNRRAR